MATLTTQQLNRLCGYLQGTCNTLHEALDALFGIDEDSLTREDYAGIDELVFLCEDCGWWCCISEMSDNADGDWKCEDCAPNEEDY